MRDEDRLAREALRSERVWAVVGASRDPERYGHEVVAALRAAGKTVHPVNPKYAEIDGSPCYPSLGALPERPGVVVLAIAPERSVGAVAGVPWRDALVWLPPGCFSEEALVACRDAGLKVVSDVCPVGLSKSVVPASEAHRGAPTERGGA